MAYASRSPSEDDVQRTVKWVYLLAGTAIVFGLRVREGRRVPLLAKNVSTLSRPFRSIHNRDLSLA